MYHLGHGSKSKMISIGILQRQYGHPCVATVEMKVRVKVGTGRKIGLLPFSRFCATPPPRAMVSLPNLQNISLFPGCTFLLTLIGFWYFYSIVCHYLVNRTYCWFQKHMTIVQSAGALPVFITFSFVLFSPFFDYLYVDYLVFYISF